MDERHVSGRRARRSGVRVLREAGAILAVAGCWSSAAAQSDALVVAKGSQADFRFVVDGRPASVRIDSQDSPTVRLVAGLFAEDVERVTGRRPRVDDEREPSADRCVIAGTIDGNRAIGQLAASGKIDVSAVQGRWESCLIQVVENPLPGVDRALVVAGSDRRGTAYGLFEISKQMGVSPWYDFADVPPNKRSDVVVRAGAHVQGPPSVKYRGIFINDEMWGLRPWAMNTFAPEEGHGLGPRTYAKIFELMLRLKANYLWPAMHDGVGGTRPFNLYPDNKVVADRYGIVMGSSHIEPMLRNNIAGAEWDIEYPGEPWDYVANRDHIYKYWEDRVKSNGMYENVYTVGKRGKDDYAGSEITPSVLERIIADQRTILRTWVNQNVALVPQVLIAYTEVLGLYNQGLALPDDITLCWPDDNYGYIRQLPDERERRRSGGSGVYYHFQWLNGASNAYTWLSTTSLGLTWEEMRKAYDYQARTLWVVNVGDIKPAEIGIEFFMQMAWNADRWGPTGTRKFLEEWAVREFGKGEASAIADILERHYQLNFARRPEHMVMQTPGNGIKWDWFSLVNFNDEAQLRIDACQRLIQDVDRVYAALPKESKAPFYEMVLYNAKGAALHNIKVLCAQKSAAYGAEGRASAAMYARKAREAAEVLAKLIDVYNTALPVVGAKWNHMASLPGPWGGQGRQWNMPPLSDFSGEGPPRLSLALEGGDPNAVADLSGYTRGRRFIDLFNRGRGEIVWKATPSAEWLRLDRTSGRFVGEQRLWVSVDWRRAPSGTDVRAAIVFETSAGDRRIVVPVFNPATPARDEVTGFVESHGCVSMEAEHYSKRWDGLASWREIEGVGRNGTCMGVVPATVESVDDPAAIVGRSPWLGYEMVLFSTGEFDLEFECLPTQPVGRGRGVCLAASMDGGVPQILAGRGGDVLANVRRVGTKVSVEAPGTHRLRVWMVDPGVVLDKIVLFTHVRAASYLGPPESYRGKAPVGDGAPVHLVEEAPAAVAEVAPGVNLVDFGRVAFGNLRLVAPAGASGNVTVHFGEELSGGRVERKPPGSVRYGRVEVPLEGGRSVIVAPPPDKRNTAQPAAVLTPSEWGVVLPFRWVEIEGWPGELRSDQIRRRAAFSSAWDDDAASFTCSDPMVARIWELCRYSIKATTFAGVYVDGDRERISYEADSYLNQLSHYAVEGDVQMARDTFDRLLKLPTWPTEWAPHMVFMAHADWMRTGDAAWLAARYEALKGKLLLERRSEGGLVVSTEAEQARGDLVDWPAGERDGFVFTRVNTVVNAFHLRALTLMAELARALGKRDEAASYGAMEREGRAAFQRVLFDERLGLYRDGEGTDHTSLHANLFPLAFGLVPSARRSGVARWLADRGMACSVYAAQYLLEALFESGEDVRALALMTAEGDRSWRHMVESGTTITWEAWDQRFKPNQDWNHAWGAAPANLLPRYVLGVQPLTPGWGRAAIRPYPGGLKHAEGKVPTPRGPVGVRWSAGKEFKLALSLPSGMTARVWVPAMGDGQVWVDGRRASAHREAGGWVLDSEVRGEVEIEVRGTG